MPGLDRSLDRRQLLSVLGTASVASLAGCSSNEPEGANPDYTREDTPTDSPTPTETETEEPVEIPVSFTYDELKEEIGWEAVYHPEDWSSNVPEERIPVNKHMKEKAMGDLDFEAIAEEYDTRAEQVEEVLYQTTSTIPDSRRNAHLGIIALQQLPWVEGTGEEMMADEATVRWGGERPAVAVTYKDEGGEENLVMVVPHGSVTDEAWDDLYIENLGASELATEGTYATAHANIEGMKDMLRELGIDDSKPHIRRTRKIDDNFVLGLNFYMGDEEVEPKEVRPVTLSEQHYQLMDEGFEKDPKLFKKLRFGVSMAAQKAQNLEEKYDDYAVNAQVADEKLVYEIISESKYEEIAPQLEL